MGEGRLASTRWLAFATAVMLGAIPLALVRIAESQESPAPKPPLAQPDHPPTKVDAPRLDAEEARLAARFAGLERAVFRLVEFGPIDDQSEIAIPRADRRESAAWNSGSILGHRKLVVQESALRRQ